MIKNVPNKQKRMPIPTYFVHKKGSEIGNGGFGKVYKQEIDGQLRAVKWLFDSHALESLEKEAEALILLQHDYVTKFIGLAMGDGCLGLILEYLEGGDLFSYLYGPSQSPLDDKLRYTWSFQIASGLAYIHSKNVVHCDIKSLNILLTHDHQIAKVGDFGLATFQKCNVKMESIEGTQYYLAPELKNKTGAYHSTTDIFAFGLILYEIFGRKAIQENFQYDDLRFIEPDKIKSLIKQCISHNPLERPDCVYILKQLQPVVDFEKKKNEYVTAVPSLSPVEKKIISLPIPSQTVSSEVRQALEKGQGLLKSGEYEKALLYLKEAAEAQLPEAQNAIGTLFFRGLGVPQDYMQSLVWFQKAANTEFPEALNNLAHQYSQGLGVEKDMSKAIVLYQKAAIKGDPSAQYNLGYIYQKGVGVELDYVKSMQWFTKAASLGDAEAENSIGFLFANGLGVTQDYQQALFWYKKSAKQGYAAAENNIGYLYENGLGVRQSTKEAISWYRKAAHQGNIGAMKRMELLE